jgi:hypothetical protein
LFRDIELERTAEKSLQVIKQKKSVGAYVAEFQRYVFRTTWNNIALMSAFYQGLKDNIKDKLSRIDVPDNKDIDKLQERAIKINNQLYERVLEKKGLRGYRNPRSIGLESHQPEPMDLDALNISPKELKRRRDRKLCFQCGKLGHLAKEHFKEKSKTEHTNAIDNMLETVD